METYVTVHAVIKNRENKFLILQRAKHRSNPGSWNHVTGYIQDRESAEQAALREMKEETNLTGKVIDTTEPFWVDIKGTRWVVITSLIEADEIDDLQIDESESQVYDWIELTDPRIESSDGMKASFAELGLIR